MWGMAAAGGTVDANTQPAVNHVEYDGKIFEPVKEKRTDIRYADNATPLKTAYWKTLYAEKTALRLGLNLASLELSQLNIDNKITGDIKKPDYGLLFNAFSNCTLSECEGVFDELIAELHTFFNFLSLCVSQINMLKKGGKVLDNDSIEYDGKTYYRVSESLLVDGADGSWSKTDKDKRGDLFKDILTKKDAILLALNKARNKRNRLRIRLHLVPSNYKVDNIEPTITIKDLVTTDWRKTYENFMKLVKEAQERFSMLHFTVEAVHILDSKYDPANDDDVVLYKDNDRVLEYLVSRWQAGGDVDPALKAWSALDTEINKLVLEVNESYREMCAYINQKDGTDNKPEERARTINVTNIKPSDISSLGGLVTHKKEWEELLKERNALRVELRAQKERFESLKNTTTTPAVATDILAVKPEISASNTIGQNNPFREDDDFENLVLQTLQCTKDQAVERIRKLVKYENDTGYSMQKILNAIPEDFKPTSALPETSSSIMRMHQRLEALEKINKEKQELIDNMNKEIPQSCGIGVSGIRAMLSVLPVSAGGSAPAAKCPICVMNKPTLDALTNLTTLVGATNPVEGLRNYTHDNEVQIEYLMRLIDATSEGAIDTIVEQFKESQKKNPVGSSQQKRILAAARSSKMRLQLEAGAKSDLEEFKNELNSAFGQYYTADGQLASIQAMFAAIHAAEDDLANFKKRIKDIIQAKWGDYYDKSDVVESVVSVVEDLHAAEEALGDWFKDTDCVQPIQKLIEIVELVQDSLKMHDAKEIMHELERLKDLEGNLKAIIPPTFAPQDVPDKVEQLKSWRDNWNKYKRDDKYYIGQLKTVLLDDVADVRLGFDVLMTEIKSLKQVIFGVDGVDTGRFDDIITEVQKRGQELEIRDRTIKNLEAAAQTEGDAKQQAAEVISLKSELAQSQLKIETLQKQCEKVKGLLETTDTDKAETQSELKTLRDGREAFLQGCTDMNNALKEEVKTLKFKLETAQRKQTHVESREPKPEGSRGGAYTAKFQLNDRVSYLLQQLHNILDKQSPFDDEVLTAKAFIQIAKHNYPDLKRLLNCYGEIFNEFLLTMAHEASSEGGDREHIHKFLEEKIGKIIDDLETRAVNETHPGEEIEVATEDDEQDSLLSKERYRSGVSSNESSAATQHDSSLKDKQSHESNLREASTSNQQDTTERSSKPSSVRNAGSPEESIHKPSEDSKDRSRVASVGWHDARFQPTNANDWKYRRSSASTSKSGNAKSTDRTEHDSPAKSSRSSNAHPDIHTDSVTNWLRDLNSVWI
jgi:hypothetical protein